MFCRAAHSDPEGPKSFLKVELNLSSACTKDIEATPSAVLCCVLQALAIQGELQNKIKLFSKCTCQCCILVNLINCRIIEQVIGLILFFENFNQQIN